MEFDFEKSLKLCLNAMRIVRTHPDVPLDYKWALQYGACYGCFTVLMLLMVQNTYNNILEDEFAEACRNGILCLAYFGAGMNNFIMFYHRSTIKTLLDLMKNDYNMAKRLPKDDQTILHKYVSKETFLCKQWFVICCLSVGLFSAKCFVLMVYYYIIGEPRLVQLYDLRYPDVIEERKDDILVFILIYIVVFLYGFYGCLIYLSFIPIGPIFMLHACGHLEVIKKHIDTLFDGEPDEANGKLNEIVKKMQYTYNFVELVKDRFQFFYEATLNLSAFSLPVTFYELLESIGRGEFSLEFSSFLFSGLLLSSTPCYYSDLLLEKGEEVSLALYTCGWERHYDVRVRSTILILLIRSTRRIALRTMFRTLCLDALTDMLQRAYAIFNLMNAVLD